MVLRNQLQTLTRQAAAAERAATEVEATAATLLENKASHFVHMLERQTNTVRKAINVVEQRCMTAATAMAEQASTAETALLQQLATSHETRRAAIAAEIEKAKLLEYALHEERVNKRQAQEKVLEEMRKKEHAGHDELWHQLSSQATELALELSLAKHDQLFTADKLGYNVRVLGKPLARLKQYCSQRCKALFLIHLLLCYLISFAGERNKENKEVLTQLQRNVHKQKALLAGLRSQYAEEKSSTSAAQDKFKKDAEHACQSLNSLKDKALHFEIADEEELRQVRVFFKIICSKFSPEPYCCFLLTLQLVAFKEERLSELVGNLKDAQMKICQLCGAGLQACFCEIKLPPPPSSEGVQIDEALNEAHWREKLHDSIPEGLHQELKMLEAAVRQDL